MIKKLFLLFLFLMGLAVCAKSQTEDGLEARRMALLYNDNSIAQAKTTSISEINQMFYLEGSQSERLVFANGKVEYRIYDGMNLAIVPMSTSKNGNVFTIKPLTNSIVVNDNPNYWLEMTLMGIDVQKAKTMVMTPQEIQVLKNQQRQLASDLKRSMQNKSLTSELLRFDNSCIVMTNNGKIRVYFTDDGLSKYEADFEKVKAQWEKEEEIRKAEEKAREEARIAEEKAREEARRREERWRELMSFPVSSNNKDLQEIVYGDNRCLYVDEDGTEKFDTFWSDSSKVVENKGVKFIVKFSQYKNYILIENTKNGERYISRFNEKYLLTEELDPYKIFPDVKRCAELYEVVKSREEKALAHYDRIGRKVCVRDAKLRTCTILSSDIKISSIAVEDSKIIIVPKKKVQVPEIEIQWTIKVHERDEKKSSIVYLSKDKDSGFIVFYGWAGYLQSAFPVGPIYVLFDKDFVFQVKDEDGKMIMNALDNYLKK